MERQKMIYEQLLHNAEEIKIVKNSVKLKRSVLEDNPILTSSFPFQLPIMTVEELENVEKSVTEDDEILQSFIKRLSLFGGSSMRSVVHQTMNGLLNKELACQYSLCGRSGKKKKFSDLKIFHFVIGECLYVYF